MQTPTRSTPRANFAATLPARRAPVLPITARMMSSRVLQIRHAPQQLSLFPLRTDATRPIDSRSDMPLEDSPLAAALASAPAAR